MTVATAVQRVSPWAWLAVAGVAGLGVLVWHQYAQDDTDTDWTMAKEVPVPVMAGLAVTPAPHSRGRPMSCGDPFRGRSYPATLTAADGSVIGEC